MGTRGQRAEAPPAAAASPPKLASGSPVMGAWGAPGALPLKAVREGGAAGRRGGGKTNAPPRQG